MAAAVKFGHPPLPMDCRLCRRDPERRAEWGCEGPVAEGEPPILELFCPLCGGEDSQDPDDDGDDLPDEQCPLCEPDPVYLGKRKVLIRECPMRLLHPEALRVCEALELLEVGVLPAGSSDWDDYPATFRRALGIVGREKRRYETWRRAAAARSAQTRAPKIPKG